MLGTYFSCRDTLEVFKSFVMELDFEGADIVAAMRKLFCTFKPAGEGQVIARILELFSEAYFLEWKRNPGWPQANFQNADSVLQVAMSLIMLNTGLHLACKKVGKKAAGAGMSLEEYVGSVRQVVPPEEVPEEALRCWYEAVKESEIAIEPTSRVPFAALPVQPSIEGWLVVVLGARVSRRCWAVLVLQRMYLFSDASDVEPAGVIDLKEVQVSLVKDYEASKVRFHNDLLFRLGCVLLPVSFTTRKGRCELLSTGSRAFEVRQNSDGAPRMLGRLSQSLGRPSKLRERLVLVAETPDLMERWVSLIEAGPYC